MSFFESKNSVDSDDARGQQNPTEREQASGLDGLLNQ